MTEKMSDASQWLLRKAFENAEAHADSKGCVVYPSDSLRSEAMTENWSWMKEYVNEMNVNEDVGYDYIEGVGDMYEIELSNGSQVMLACCLNLEVSSSADLLVRFVEEDQDIPLSKRANPYWGKKYLYIDTRDTYNTATIDEKEKNYIDARIGIRTGIEKYEDMFIAGGLDDIGSYEGECDLRDFCKTNTLLDFDGALFKLFAFVHDSATLKGGTMSVRRDESLTHGRCDVEVEWKTDYECMVAPCSHVNWEGCCPIGDRLFFNNKCRCYADFVVASLNENASE